MTQWERPRSTMRLVPSEDDVAAAARERIQPAVVAVVGLLSAAEQMQMQLDDMRQQLRALYEDLTGHSAGQSGQR